MTSRASAEPTLYDADTPGTPTLHGRRCSACGHIFFPPQDYGCEACGATPEHLAVEDLAGIGTLIASAAVLRHPLAPFAVGTVILDAGPPVRAVIETPGTRLLPGTRVHASLVPSGHDDDGVEVVELRFAAGDA